MSENKSPFRGTTIVAVKKNGKTAVAGDGQVTMGEHTIMKGAARKRSAASITTRSWSALPDRWRTPLRCAEKFEDVPGASIAGNLPRAAVELASRTGGMDKRGAPARSDAAVPQTLKTFCSISGTGEVIEPDGGVLAIGTGGNFALSRRPRARHEDTDHRRPRKSSARRMKVASDICVYTNDQHHRGGRSDRKETAMIQLTPRARSSEELDRYYHRPGRGQARRRRRAAQPLSPQSQLEPEDIREEVTPKNILMVGPTGVGKTEIARRLAKLRGRAAASRSRPPSSPRSATSAATSNPSSAIWSRPRIRLVKEQHGRATSAPVAEAERAGAILGCAGSADPIGQEEGPRQPHRRRCSATGPQARRSFRRRMRDNRRPQREDAVRTRPDAAARLEREIVEIEVEDTAPTAVRSPAPT